MIRRQAGGGTDLLHEMDASWQIFLAHHPFRWFKLKAMVVHFESNRSSQELSSMQQLDNACVELVVRKMHLDI